MSLLAKRLAFISLQVDETYVQETLETYLCVLSFFRSSAVAFIF